VAYPKKDPAKIAIGAGISLPADLKKRATELAAGNGKSLSMYVRELLAANVEKAARKLEKSGQAKLAQAQKQVSSGLAKVRPSRK
jgi:hypothetical protein